MKNDNKVTAAFLAVLAAVVMIAYLFFGMEEDIDEELPRPIPAIPEELLKPRAVSEQD